MVTEAARDAEIEELLREVNSAPEPGDSIKEQIIDRGGDNKATMVRLPTKSAGYTTVYNTRTGVSSIVNNNNLRNMLMKRRIKGTDDGSDDGTFVYGLKQLVKPFVGKFNCRLHPNDPERKHFNELGLAVCKKEGLASPHEINRHMAKCHKVEWAAIEQERLDREKKEEREFQRQLLTTVTGKREKEAKTYTCDGCNEVFRSPLALGRHKKKCK